MNNNIRKAGALGVLALGLAVPSLCRPAQAGLLGRKTIQSGWTAAPVTVDGADTEWRTDRPYENEGVAVAARNDGEYLYVYVSPKDKEVRSQFAGDYGQSFFVWLDPSGGKHTALGVKLARQKSAAVPGRPAAAQGDKTQAGAQGQPPDVQLSSGAAPGEPPQGGPAGEPTPGGQAAQEPAYTAGFVTDDADSPASDLTAEGMEAAVGTIRSRITVEIKVPLSKLEDLKDGTFGLGVQTTEPDAALLASLKTRGGDKPAHGGQPPSGGSASGGPGGMGGERPSGPPPGGNGGSGAGGPPPGGMGSGGPGAGAQSSSSSSSDSGVTVDPVKFWLKVKLSSR